MSFPIRLVETPEALAQLVATLGRPSRLAVDTEAASYHKYSDGVCLVQLSTPELTAVVDPDDTSFWVALPYVDSSQAYMMAIGRIFP